MSSVENLIKQFEGDQSSTKKMEDMFKDGNDINLIDVPIDESTDEELESIIYTTNYGLILQTYPRASSSTDNLYKRIKNIREDTNPKPNIYVDAKFTHKGHNQIITTTVNGEDYIYPENTLGISGIGGWSMENAMKTLIRYATFDDKVVYPNSFLSFLTDIGKHINKKYFNWTLMHFLFIMLNIAYERTKEITDNKKKIEQTNNILYEIYFGKVSGSKKSGAELNQTTSANVFPVIIEMMGLNFDDIDPNNMNNILSKWGEITTTKKLIYNFVDKTGNKEVYGGGYERALEIDKIAQKLQEETEALEEEAKIINKYLVGADNKRGAVELDNKDANDVKNAIAVMENRYKKIKESKEYNIVLESGVKLNLELRNFKNLKGLFVFNEEIKFTTGMGNHEIYEININAVKNIYDDDAETDLRDRSKKYYDENQDERPRTKKGMTALLVSRGVAVKDRKLFYDYYGF